MALFVFKRCVFCQQPYHRDVDKMLGHRNTSNQALGHVVHSMLVVTGTELMKGPPENVKIQSILF